MYLLKNTEVIKGKKILLTKVINTCLMFCLGICLNHADITKDLVECVPEKGLMGKAFKGAAKGVMEHLAKLSSEEVIALEEKMNSDG